MKIIIKEDNKDKIDEAPGDFTQFNRPGKFRSFDDMYPDTKADSEKSHPDDDQRQQQMDDFTAEQDVELAIDAANQKVDDIADFIANKILPRMARDNRNLVKQSKINQLVSQELDSIADRMEKNNLRRSSGAPNLDLQGIRAPPRPSTQNSAQNSASRTPATQAKISEIKIRIENK